eukprot:gene43044-52604_t
MNSTSSRPIFFSDASHYEHLSQDFSSFHSLPLNVLLHLLTTPLGVVGLCSLLRSVTKSSSALGSLMLVYLLSLLPTLPLGDFLGTAMLCVGVLAVVHVAKMQAWQAVALVVAGYALQDLAHEGLGEKTFQSSYSAGGHIDLSAPGTWLLQLLQHTYYLLPLCVHAALPWLLPLCPSGAAEALQLPLPSSLQQLYSFQGVLGPLIACALG